MSKERKNQSGGTVNMSYAPGSSYWRDCIDVLGETLRGDSNNESKIHRAAHISGARPRTIRSLYYAEVSEPRYSVGRSIEAAAQKQAERLLALADSLSATNADMFRSEIDRLRALAGRVGRLPGP